MRLILLGAPGSGKGTQAALIAGTHSIVQVSTGDLFRKHLAEKTELGKTAQKFMSAGELVPDDLVLSMVLDRLKQPDAANGFILDGFPRTLPQAEGLVGLLAELGVALDHVLLIDVVDELIVDRLSARRTCGRCGTIYHLKAFPPRKEGICDKCNGELTQREDDVPETIRQRLHVYHDATEPLIAYYQGAGLLRKIDGTKSPEQVAAEVDSVLAA